MKAGRELDALVAEKVMGWKLSNATDGTEYWDNGKFCGGIWPKEWNPSTNIADAWNVVEKMKSKDYLFSLKNIVKGTFTFSLTDWGGNCSTYAAEAETAPLAICLAALKAVGVE